MGVSPDDLVYPTERALGTITLVLGCLAWLALIAGTFGAALIALAAGFVFYLFLQSALIAHIKGNGVELSASQFPDLHAQFEQCCDRLQIKTRPQAFIVNGNGVLNAFATKFLGAQYVVLNSGVVDAMARHADGVRFYVGHELGHLRMKHLRAHFLRYPAMWLPLLGAAYSRARESTCDRHGRACCASGDGAARAIAALSAGPHGWQQLDVDAYLGQAQHSGGFWMSFHELTSGYPWLTKRAARVADASPSLPRRSAFAYVPAAIVPYAGRLGAGFGMLMLVYIVAVLAAVALPAYRDYQVRAQLAQVIVGTQPAREALARYYEANRKAPASLDQVGVRKQLPDGTPLTLDPENGSLTVTTKAGELILEPSSDSQGRITWNCRNGEQMKASQLPPACTQGMR